MTTPGDDPASSERRWRFPRGAGALPPEVMDEIQRGRIFEATCVAIAEQGGFANTSIAAIVARAGVSSKTFYDHFADKEDCASAAFEAYAARLAADLHDAWSSAGDLANGVPAAIAALLSFAAEAPAPLRFLLLDAQTAGSALRDAQRRAIDRLAAELRAARPVGGGEAQPPAVEQMIVAAIGWRVGIALIDSEPLERLQPALCEFALAAYDGLAQAGSEPERGSGKGPEHS
jgi:AcrR family transcriptional regulator